MKRTASQQLAIDTRGRELVVSAGAGAGKTSVLVERIYRLLCDEPRCTVEELLVVTFSRAAAAEMRERLAARIEHALEDTTLPGDLREHLEEQAFLMPRAAISTIHSFCLSILTAHPAQAGMAPGFDLMSEEEARLFRREFLRRKLEETLAVGGAAAEVLARILGDLDPVNGAEALREVIASVCAFLDALPFPDEFVKATLAVYGSPDDGPLHALVARHQTQSLEVLVMQLDRLAAMGPGLSDAKLSADAESVAALARSLRSLAGCGAAILDMTGWKESLNLPRAPAYKGEDEACLRYKEERSDVVSKLRTLRTEAPVATRADVTREVQAGGPVVRALLHDVALRWNAALLEEHIGMRRLTFAHLERLALRVLLREGAHPSDAALAYRQQFHHVLVDESQDVNELQDLILRSIAHPAEEGGNLFMVGDIKQSIYAFRQAEPELFLARMRDSKPVASDPGGTGRGCILLSENFRSAPALLEEFNAIFSGILRTETVGIEYADGHAFAPGRTGGGRRGPAFSMAVLPRAASVDGDGEESDDVSFEADYVADMVERIGPPWRDICILLRSTVGPVQQLTEALAQRRIPTFTDARLGFLTAVEVIEVQTLLRAIHNPYDEIALLGLLRGPLMEWSADDLMDLRTAGPRTLLHDTMRRLAGDGTHPLSARCADFIARLRRWQAQAQRLPMGDLMAALHDEFDLLERAAVRPGGDQRRLNLLYLAEKARQFDGFLAKGLGSFLEFVEDMIENQEDFAPPSPLPDGADVVRIMTIHKSKGMQFPIVVYPFLGKKFNDANGRAPVQMDRSMGVATRLTPRADDATDHVYTAMRYFRRRRERGEELRLFYVSLTRAQEAAYLVGSAKDPEEAMAEARARVAALSPGEVLDATSPLPWVLSHAAGRFPEAPLEADWDGGDHVQTDGIASLRMVPFAYRLQRGEPVPPPSAAPVVEITGYDSARARIAALEARPPRPAIRAKVSVTEAKRAFDAQRDAETPPMRPPRSARPRAAADWMPKFAEATPRRGVDRGRATHRFLALCDLVSLAWARRTLRAECDRLVEERLLEPAEAALVDLHALGWFLNSPLGHRLRREDARVHREKPFTIRVDGDEVTAGTTQPIILQGVVDVLWREEAGWILADYKTDDTGVDGARVTALAAAYEPQLQLYRLLVERTLRQPVAEAWLIFLGARQSIPVPAARPGAIPWQAVIEAGAVLHGEPPARRPRIAGV